MTNKREMRPPPGFLIPPHLPNVNTNERPPVTTTVFAATTPRNTAFAYRASTLTDPTPMISPAFVEANYEILKSLLRDRRRQIRNEDLRIELEYFSKYYDKEREMEPSLNEPRKSLHLFARDHPGFIEQGRKQNQKEYQGSNRICDPLCSLDRGLSSPRWLKMPSHVGSYDGKGDPNNFLHLFKGAIQQETHLAVHNIKQREGKSVRAFTARYTDDTLQILGLHEDQRIFGFVQGLRTRNLVKHLSTDLSSTYKDLMEKIYT
ncbi:hypothetical protein Tco_0891412 [Tanacetum coccineum]|uniref:Reverse transcriptase domain-containing protein n=1 Tax=Tanacetum coccineum TaxID=301880 RepID=A0ABQ5C2V0_9ASTR